MISATELAIGDGILSALGEKMAQLELAGRAFVVTDRRVAQRYAEPALETLSRAGFRPSLLAIEGNEQAKSLDGAAEVYRWLADEHAERRDTVVALGGGVIGDLGGFVAATYLRGIALVQVPTTVLAQVDSAIGGKTAINLPQGKNLVGAFHMPRLTLVDIAFLDHLPARDLHNGWAEVLKTAVIFDRELFEQIEAAPPEAMQRGQLLDVIARCVQWKTKVVEEDPTERGPRMLLNFGHTIGHAIEAAAGYRTYLHGEAVSIGMVGAMRLSQRLELIEETLVGRVEDALARCRLPVRYDPGVVTAPAILAAAASDKKAVGATLRWILSTGLGQTKISSDVPVPLVREVLLSLAVRPELAPPAAPSAPAALAP